MGAAIAIAPAYFQQALRHCDLCPRQCGVNRVAGEKGYCGAGVEAGIAAITVHHGEEPVLSGKEGICNVFFSGCNLRCCYCQNAQISRPHGLVKAWSISEATAKIREQLDRGVKRLGFVSPSHMAPQMLAILKALHDDGCHPVVIYNSNGYDRLETLRLLEPWVDIYLPDCKYMDADLGRRWSGVADYPQVAALALAEMYRQKGNLLHCDQDGLALRGLMVRHLVLPGQVENSLAVLRFVAERLSPRLHLSLMAQYAPMPSVANHPLLGRRLNQEEYQRVCAAVEGLGFEHGFFQSLSSADSYCPDFSQEEPFGDAPAGEPVSLE